MITPEMYNELRIQEQQGQEMADEKNKSIQLRKGFVDVLSQELKGVLEKLLDNTTVKMYNLTKDEYAYDFI